MPAVLFICTANRFRSVLAAHLFQHLVQEHHKEEEWKVGSAGIWASPEQGAAPFLLRFAAQFGLDLQTHRSQGVTAELLEQYDLILVMEKGQQEALSIEFHQVASRILTLGEAAEGIAYDIPEPRNNDEREMLGIALDLKRIIERGFERICTLALQQKHR
jgi:protein-tyrosine phosphatase